MKNNRNFRCAMVMVFAFVGNPVMAGVLQIGDLLTIGEGSWFALDSDGDGWVYEDDKALIYPGSDGGITIGRAQEIGEIDTWTLSGIAGAHYTTAPLAGGTETGIDFSPWSIFWNGERLLDGNYVDDGAWVTSNCEDLGCTGITFLDATAALVWNGVYGDSYSLWFSWRFNASPGCFGCTSNYLLNINGVVHEAVVVPIPPAFWLFGFGLVGLFAGAQPRFVVKLKSMCRAM